MREETPCDARLIRNDDDEEARCTQLLDGLCRPVDEAQFVRRPQIVDLDVDGAIAVEKDGRPQWLRGCGVRWHYSLTRIVADLAVHGVRLRGNFAPGKLEHALCASFGQLRTERFILQCLPERVGNIRHV